MSGGSVESVVPPLALEVVVLLSTQVGLSGELKLSPKMNLSNKMIQPDGPSAAADHQRRYVDSHGGF